MKLFDLHCDTLTECAYTLSGRALAEGARHISLERGGFIDDWTQVFAVFMPDEYRGAGAAAYYEGAIGYLKRQLMLSKGRLNLCTTEEDLQTPGTKGSCKAFLSVEGGSVLCGDIARLDKIYNDGVRMMTITWNGSNELGDGSGVPCAGGLTELGKRVVQRMNELRMTVDVSHLSDKGFYDVCELSQQPFVASHSNSRSVCPHRRNITDDMFTIIRDRGGIVGLNFCYYFLREASAASSYDILRHAEHFLSLGGEDTIAIGADFDGAEIPGDITGIEGMESLYELFLRENYKEELVRKIFRENAQSFFCARLGKE